VQPAVRVDPAFSWGAPPAPALTIWRLAFSGRSEPLHLKRSLDLRRGIIPFAAVFFVQQLASARSPPVYYKLA